MEAQLHHILATAYGEAPGRGLVRSNGIVSVGSSKAGPVRFERMKLKATGGVPEDFKCYLLSVGLLDRVVSMEAEACEFMFARADGEKLRCTVYYKLSKTSPFKAGIRKRINTYVKEWLVCV